MIVVDPVPMALEAPGDETDGTATHVARSVHCTVQLFSAGTTIGTAPVRFNS